MSKLKIVIYKVLGQKKYLKFLYKSFLFLYDTGSLKNNENYKFHYFVKYLIHKGDYVVDFGANQGYFSTLFSRLVGSAGKVFCIEPVKPFFETLRSAVGNNKNCVLYNYALGLENKTIEMIVPKNEKYLRTGLAHVPVNETYNKNNSYIFTVEMKKGSELLKDLPKLNYLKCDIEGYEEFVIPEVKDIIAKHKPIIQIETWDKHKKVVFDFLHSLGYIPYGLTNKILTKNLSESYEGDFLFIHNSMEKSVIEPLQKTGKAAI